ncbi:MAG: serine hydrolase [Ferruginibacter sp.]|nr:serine hydrolase [Ferruginibacter sp.]
MRSAILFLFLFTSLLTVAQTRSRNPYRKSGLLSDSLRSIIQQLGIDSSFDVGEDGKAKVSIVVIDLSQKRPLLGEVNGAAFIYPASVCKMYVAMEVLKQVSAGKYPLNRSYQVPEHNAVDTSREIAFDPRPLLRAGDTVTINYLLDLMITRSDNSAANCLIDIAGRKNINKTMQENNWQGSEVTRKFLKRNKEDAGYDTIRPTVTNGLHAADFMYKVATNQLVNPWVSQQMKALLGRQLDKSKLAAGLPASVMFYHKSGWWSYYTHDVGLVDDGKLRYVIAVFTPLPEAEVLPTLKNLSARVYRLMRSLHK